MRHHAALLFATLLCAGPAAGQSCWPVAVALALRDSAGRPMPPVMLDSVETFSGDRRLAPRPVAAPFRPASRLSSGSALQWSVSGCRLQLDSVRLIAGSRSMTLVTTLVLDSERRRGPSVLVIESPPFGMSRHLLRWNPAEPAAHPPRLLPAARYWSRADPR